MRPILAQIPPLLPALLLPLAAVVAGVGLLMAARLKNALPLVIAVGILALGWFWSRNPITLHSYGLFLVVGFFLSTWLACAEARRRGYDPNVVLDAAMPLLVVSILLCRVLYFLIYPDQWRGLGEFLQIWNGGLSFHGAIVGALGTLGYFAWTRKVPFGTMTDFVAPGAFLGYAVGRVGCFMNGCCYGHPTNLPWAVSFPSEMNRQLWTDPSHPAQLYATGMSLVLFGVMWGLRQKPSMNRFPGQLTLLLLAFYAAERFVMEIFRAGATAPMVGGADWLTKAQLTSVLGLATVIVLWIVLGRRSIRKN